MSRSWYLLASKPKQDEKAEQQLENQGYEVYRPLAKRLRNQRGKMVERVESLFPRYLFIYLDMTTDNWAPIRSTYGVSGIIRFGMEPAKIPTNVIDELKSHEERFSKKSIDLDRFKQGDSIVIEEGAFKGVQAIFDCYDNGEQCSFVLFEIMGKLTKLPISTINISKL